MIGVACFATLTAQHLVGRRVPALEYHPKPAEWSAYYATHPGLGGGPVGPMTDDGRLLFGWANKSLAVYDLAQGKTMLLENVFAARLKDGRRVVVTDSQAGHFREQLTDDWDGPSAKVIALIGDTYVVAVHRENAPTFFVGAVHVERRGLDANELLGRIAADSERHIWSCDSGPHVLIAAQTTKTNSRASLLTLYSLSKSKLTNGLKRIRKLPVPTDIALQDIDFDRMRGVGFLLKNGRVQGCQVLNLSTGKRTAMVIPNGRPFVDANLRFAGEKTLCSFFGENPREAGDLFVSSDQKSWHRIGPYQISALSFDRRLALLWNPREVWLCRSSDLNPPAR